MANIDTEDLQDFLESLFATGRDRKISPASQKKIDAIMQHVKQNTLAVRAVEVIGARAAVDNVEAYGLDIQTDANGNAVIISSAFGFYLDGVA